MPQSCSPAGLFAVEQVVGQLVAPEVGRDREVLDLPDDGVLPIDQEQHAFVVLPEAVAFECGPQTRFTLNPEGKVRPACGDVLSRRACSTERSASFTRRNVMCSPSSIRTPTFQQLLSCHAQP